MFARILTLLPLAALLVSAECDTNGSPQCCNQYGLSNSSTITESKQYQELPIELIELIAGATVPIGLQCNAIIGDGADCSEHPVCCSNNTYNGLIVVGCSPITL